MKVIVIGAGVVGLSTAYYLRKRGFEVTVLERGGPDHDCCSLGNAGMVVPSHIAPLAAPGVVGRGLRMMLSRTSPFAIRPGQADGLLRWLGLFRRSARREHVRRAAPLLRDLGLAGRRCFEELDAASDGAFGLTQRGIAMICRTPAGLHEECEGAEHARSLGLETRILDPDETRRLEPGLCVDAAGAVFYPQDCHLDPVRLVAWLLAETERAGVTYEWGANAIGVRISGDHIVQAVTTGGSYAADAVVLAAGWLSGRLAASAGAAMPLLGGKGYSLTLPHPPRMLEVPAILTEARVAVTPIGQSLRFAGTMELGAADVTIDPRRVSGIVASIAPYFPEFGSAAFEGITPWAGLRPCSPDGLPYVGRFGRWPNLLAATGHAMQGISLGPITGKLIAETLAGEAISLDIDSLRPDRFDGAAV